MKSIKLLPMLILFFSLVLFQSCEGDPCDGVICLNDGICLNGTCDCPEGYIGVDCGNHCSDDIVGTWTVTAGTSGFCDVGTYEFSKGSTDTEILVTIVSTSGADSSTGIGTLSLDCSTMTYNIPGVSVGGTITYNGNAFTDQFMYIGGTCTFEANKL